jgi:hemerythrin superfamily protein
MPIDKDENVIAVLTQDHREVEEMFAQLEIPGLDPQKRRDIADDIIIELVRHSVAEEQFLYPAVRRALPDGDRIADKELRDHAEAERTMKELDGLDAAEARFDTLVSQLITEIRTHVLDEENSLFPRLAATCSADELQDLGRKVTAAKQVAPTRPHPGAPDRPPLNKLLGPGTGLVDRVRDALTSRGS